MAVVLLLAVLAGVALPRFFARSDEAKRAAAEAVIGSVQTGLGMVHVAYLAGNTAGLPPDVNGDNYPDHLGDTAIGEATIFDMVLEVPVTTDPYGWTQLAPFTAPWHAYFYDHNGNGTYEGTEAMLAYNTTNGFLFTSIPW